MTSAGSRVGLVPISSTAVRKSNIQLLYDLYTYINVLDSHAFTGAFIDFNAFRLLSHWYSMYVFPSKEKSLCGVPASDILVR